MNKQQKEIQQQYLDNEKQVLKDLKKTYEDALAEINGKLQLLMARQDADMQHVIYQIEYQKALKAQVQGILDQLQANQFETVSEYLTKSYEDGYIGTMYDLQGQGIPLLMPLDQEQIVEAIMHETKLSDDLYTSLGKDIKNLQKQISSEISRGISTGQMYGEIARNIAGYAGISRNNAMRIARTEGHRIQCRASANARMKAKEKGADIVKIWDASLDGKTRDTHRKLDGQIREIEEPFEVDGMEAMEPGGFGRPEEDINCRCQAISKARWLLDATETKYLGKTDEMSDEQLQPLADKLGISVEELREYSDQIIPVKADNYADFKSQYDKIWNYKGSDLQKDAEKRIAGYGAERVRSSSQKINGKEALENNGKSSKIEATRIKRKQLDTGYKGKIPDDKLEEYNKKALEQIIADTGYSEEKAKELHNALLDYFGGDYESILSGETELAKIIREGISNMPIYDGSIYRGMVFDDKDIKMFTKLKAGDSVPQKGIVESWSSNSRVAQSFGGANDYYRNTVILECENNKTGAGVQHISKFGVREAEVLTSTKYEVVEVVIESKYDYLLRHKELLYLPDDLDYVEDDVKGVVVCRIKVKEKK